MGELLSLEVCCAGLVSAAEIGSVMSVKIDSRVISLVLCRRVDMIRFLRSALISSFVFSSGWKQIASRSDRIS